MQKDTIREWCAQLSGSGWNPESGGCSTAADKLVLTDLAGALATLEGDGRRMERLVFEACWVYPDPGNEAWRAVEREAYGWALNARGITNPSKTEKDRLWRLAAHTVSRVFRPGRCRVCRGRRLTDDGVRQECVSCGGTGLRSGSDEIARAMRVRNSTYLKQYRAVYHAIAGRLLALEDAAAEWVKRALG